MKTSRRHWIPLLTGVVLLLTGWLYDATISELPRGNPPPALMDYYTRHHRIATTISSLGGGFVDDSRGFQSTVKRISSLRRVATLENRFAHAIHVRLIISRFPPRGPASATEPTPIRPEELKSAEHSDDFLPTDRKIHLHRG